MGSWGPGLYSNDAASDLKPLLSAVGRLPLEPEAILHLLVSQNPEVANNPEDEDYPPFWLVVADQLHRKGIDAREAFDRARQVLESGSDLEVHRRLGMSERDLKTRRKHLDKVAARLASPLPPRKKPLTRPQPLVMQTGDLVAVPIDSRGRVRNPYVKTEDHEPTGWAAFVVAWAGHSYGSLAGYLILNAAAPDRFETRPTPEQLQAVSAWVPELAGTCSKAHFARMGLEIVGNVPISEERLAPLAEVAAWTDRMVVQDISISNRLSYRSSKRAPLGPLSTLSHHGPSS